jgi:hypothetical protein
MIGKGDFTDDFKLDAIKQNTERGYSKRVDHDAEMKQLRDAVKEVRDKFREGIWETNKQLDQG